MFQEIIFAAILSLYMYCSTVINLQFLLASLSALKVGMSSCKLFYSELKLVHRCIHVRTRTHTYICTNIHTLCVMTETAVATAQEARDCVIK
jgi:hypothetical protein